ncbi:MAG TPA: twin-arginine translocation signal domain-containing protein, partial [Bryobacteraceae bacterium]|nr:twin-arginine translocation signal domain-containing protein [Bryobacteraceae bacterium]
MNVTRRQFVDGIATAGAVLAFGRYASGACNRVEPAVLTGDRLDLVIEATPVNITGRSQTATLVNG